MDKNAGIRSAFLRFQMTNEKRMDQLRMMLQRALLTADDQQWLASLFARSRKAPLKLMVERRGRGRPRAYPGAKDHPLWGPLLHRLDIDELVRRLDAGVLSAEDQGWLAAMLDPDSDAPLRIVFSNLPGAQADPNRVVRQYELGARADRLLRRAHKNKKKMLGRIEDRLGCSRSEVYEARRVYLEVEAAQRDI